MAVMKNLFKSVGIAIISSLIYAIYVSDRERESERYQKNIMSIFSIVMVVSFSILFIFSGSQELVPVSRSGGGSPTLNAKPPF